MKRMPARDCEMGSGGGQHASRSRSRAPSGGETHPEAGAKHERDKETFSERELLERLVEAAEGGCLPVVAAVRSLSVVVEPGVLDRGIARATMNTRSVRSDDDVRIGVVSQLDDRPRAGVVAIKVGGDGGSISAGAAEGGSEPGPEASRTRRTIGAAVAGLVVVDGQREESCLRPHC